MLATFGENIDDLNLTSNVLQLASQERSSALASALSELEKSTAALNELCSELELIQSERDAYFSSCLEKDDRIAALTEELEDKIAFIKETKVREYFCPLDCFLRMAFSSCYRWKSFWKGTLDLKRL